MSLRLQHTLGRVNINYKNGLNLNGLMTLARVIRVHHKSGTADVVTVEGGDTYKSSAENEGRYSAHILQSFANYDRDRNKSWGEINPIGVGSLVLIGFLDNKKTKPIILGAFNAPDSSHNILTTDYPLSEKRPGYSRREALKTLHVYPSQSYSKIDGESNIELSHASKSFFAMYNAAMDSQDYLTDNHGGFDHKDLTEEDPNTGEPLETDFDEAKKPAKILFVHRSSFDDLKTTWTKLFLDSTGMFRISRDNNDGSLSYKEIDPDGAQIDRVQLDSNEFGQGENYSEVVKGKDGSIKINRRTKDGMATISIDGNGIITIIHPSGSYIQLDENMQLDVRGEIFSDAISRFIEKNHLVVSRNEPENPKEGLVWVDTSM